MRTVTLSGTSNSGTILSVGTPDSSTGRRSKSTTSTWNSRSQRELTVNQLSGKLGADQDDRGTWRAYEDTMVLRPPRGTKGPDITVRRVFVHSTARAGAAKIARARKPGRARDDLDRLTRGLGSR